MPADLWNLTPAEIMEIVEARMDTRMQEWRFFDSLNGMFSSLYAAAHGVKDAKPRDYMIIPEEISEPSGVPVQGDTPETIQKKLEIMAATGLLKPYKED